MRKYLFLIFVIFIIFNITSCEWLDPAEQVPSYLQIDEVDLNVRPGEGSASHAINTVWVYVCLLYTSPSPRDRTRSRMPSSA